MAGQPWLAPLTADRLIYASSMVMSIFVVVVTGRSGRKGWARLWEERVRDFGNCFCYAFAFVWRTVFQEITHMVKGMGLVPVTDRLADIPADNRNS